VQSQLENNTTKAFINVLENCSLNISKQIIDSIVGESIASDSKKLHFTLQESTIGKERITGFQKKVVLGISPDGKIENVKRSKMTRELPDAWMWGDNFVVLLENKTRGELDSSQLDRYSKLLGGCRIVARSWKNDIYPAIAETISKSDLDETDRFLVSEFRRYMEITQLSTFQGFDIQDFSRLLSEDEDELNYTLNKFESLAALLEEPLRRMGLKQYTGKTRDWHGYARRFKHYKCYQLANFAVFEEQGVKVKLHIGSGPDLIRLKRRADTKAFRKLLMRLKENSKRSGREYEIMVQERESIARYNTDSAMEYTLYSSWMTQGRLNQLIKMIRSTDKMWFSIYQTFKPTEAAELGTKIVNRIVEVVESLLPIYRYVTKQ
jgi:hypothetical protein